MGLGEAEFFVASDIPASSATRAMSCSWATRRWRWSRRTGVPFTDFAGAEVPKTPQRVTWDPILAEKAGYKHFMLKEIHEQPWAIRETVLGRTSVERGLVFLDEMRLTDDDLRAIEPRDGAGVRHFVACGTGWQVLHRATGARGGRCRLR